MSGLEDGTSRSGIRDELEFHLEERAKEFEAEGMTPEEARRAARAAFGDVDGIEERVVAEVRRENDGRRGGGGMETWWQDVRFAVRGLRRSPGFTLVALLTLALGIGANSGIYSVIDGVFLRSPQVRAPEQLVNVYTTCRRGDPRCSSSYPDYLDYGEAGSLAGLAATAGTSLNAAEDGRPPLLLDGMLVSGNYFELLGVVPALGRLLQPADDVPGAPAPVAVLAWDTWQADFAGDPAVIGRTLRLNGDATEIVGVAARGFNGTGLTDDPDVFLPITSVGGTDTGAAVGGERTGPPVDGILQTRGARWMSRLVGRLAPGATLEQAETELASIGERLRELDPDARGDRMVTVDRAERFSLPQFGREDLTRFIGLLGAVVGFTLLLACANVANLLLARGSARRAEVGIRKALGAGRGRIVRQLTVEAVVLSVLGGVAGLAVSMVVVRVLSTASLPGGVRLSELGIGVDGRMLAFTMALSLVTGLLFGLAPALRSGAVGISAVIKGEGGSRSRGGNRLRKSLVGVQVGLCLTLLVGSLLFVQTLRNGLARDLGYRPEGVASVRFNLAALDMGEEEGEEALRRMVEAVERLPGVESASWYSRIPFQNGGAVGVFAEIEGYVPTPDEEIRVEIVRGGPDALRTLGIPLEAGRPMSGSESVPSVWINRTMADRYFAGRDPIGRRITMSGAEAVVAGVTADVDWDAVGEENINNLFFSAGLRDVASSMSVSLVARGSGDASLLLDDLRREARAVVPGVAFIDVRTAADMVGASLATQRLGARLLTMFGVLALALATIGIGGVVGYLVNQRRRDIGLRLALGASSGRILGEITREMALPVLAGSALGLALALVLGRSIDGFLLGVSSRSVVPYVVSTLALVGIALVAVVIPARTSSRIEPMQALRRE